MRLSNEKPVDDRFARTYLKIFVTAIVQDFVFIKRQPM